MKKLLLILMLSISLVTMAQTEVEVITANKSCRVKVINECIRKRESTGWKLVDIKFSLVRVNNYSEITEPEYILVFEK